MSLAARYTFYNDSYGNYGTNGVYEVTASTFNGRAVFQHHDGAYFMFWAIDPNYPGGDGWCIGTATTNDMDAVLYRPASAENQEDPTAGYNGYCSPGATLFGFFRAYALDRSFEVAISDQFPPDAEGVYAPAGWMNGFPYYANAYGFYLLYYIDTMNPWWIGWTIVDNLPVIGPSRVFYAMPSYADPHSSGVYGPCNPPLTGYATVTAGESSVNQPPAVTLSVERLGPSAVWVTVTASDPEEDALSPATIYFGDGTSIDAAELGQGYGRAYLLTGTYDIYAEVTDSNNHVGVSDVVAVVVSSVNPGATLAPVITISDDGLTYTVDVSGSFHPLDGGEIVRASINWHDTEPMDDLDFDYATPVSHTYALRGNTCIEVGMQDNFLTSVVQTLEINVVEATPGGGEEGGSPRRFGHGWRGRRRAAVIRAGAATAPEDPDIGGGGDPPPPLGGGPSWATGMNLAWWGSASEGVTVDNGVVTEWAPQYGAHPFVAAPTFGPGPSLITGGAGTINGQPVITFSASGLADTGLVFENPGIDWSLDDFTVLTLRKGGEMEGQFTMIWSAGAMAEMPGQFLSFLQHPPDLEDVLYSYALYPVSPGAVMGGVAISGLNVQPYRNNTALQVTSQQNGENGPYGRCQTSAIESPFHLGYNPAWGVSTQGMGLAELLIFKKALTLTEVQTVYAQFYEKYGLPSPT